MGRKLSIAICSGLMCFALAACGDDPLEDPDALRPPADPSEVPQRTPGSRPPEAAPSVDDSGAPPPQPQ